MKTGLRQVWKEQFPEQKGQGFLLRQSLLRIHKDCWKFISRMWKKQLLPWNIRFRLKEFQERVRRIQKRYPYLAAWKDGKIVGYAYASPFKERAAYDWAVETSIYVCRTEKEEMEFGKKLYGALEEALGGTAYSSG